MLHKFFNIAKLIKDIKEIHFHDLDEKFASPDVTSVKEYNHMFDYYFGNLEKNIIKSKNRLFCMLEKEVAHHVARVKKNNNVILELNMSVIKINERPPSHRKLWNEPSLFS